MRVCFSHVNGTSLDIDMQQRFHAGCNRSYNSALGAFVRCRPEVDILPGKPGSAVCVQLSIDSRNSAIHSAYRTLLRPSSLPEPRDPSLKVVKTEVIYNNKKIPGSLEIGYLLVAALPNEGSDSHLRVNPPPFPEASCAHSKIQV